MTDKEGGVNRDSLGPMFLIRKKRCRVYHIFEGNDTMCRTYSTGGMRKSKFMVVHEPPEGTTICLQCKNNRHKRIIGE
jgi:hypothetical protein